MKEKSIKDYSSECLEELVDSCILGKVGTELYAEAVCSALFPNPFGIICIKTKVSFITFEVIYIVVIIC